MLRWALPLAVALAAVAAISLTLVLRTDAKPTTEQFVTWRAGEQHAPAIALRTPAGSPASPQGRTTIVTFVDPHCTTFCPRESLVIDDALRTLPAVQRPAVVAVSVDPTVTSPRVFAQEAKRFRWLPQWRWATGSRAALTRVWDDYHVTVVPTKGDITHTELAYVIDAKGDERALLLWPFRANDVLRALAASS